MQVVAERRDHRPGALAPSQARIDDQAATGVARGVDVRAQVRAWRDVACVVVVVPVEMPL